MDIAVNSVQDVRNVRDEHGIRTIANLGSGTMGHATALQFAMHGFPVRMWDVSQDALDHGMDLIAADAKTLVSRGIIEGTAVDGVIANVTTTTTYEQAISGADFVIESVPERLDLKRSVWRQVEQFAGRDTILATNTSGLSPTAIAQVLQRPERFIVAHFYNPAHLMPLVEVVPGLKTSREVVRRTVALLNGIGKHAVALEREAPGFVGNRIQAAVIREALYIVRQGIATPQAVDDIVKYSLGLRWSILGPIISADLGGLDVFDALLHYLSKELCNDESVDPALEKKVREGDLGLKTGHGFYDWTGAQARRIVEQRDERLFEAAARERRNAQVHAGIPVRRTA